MSDSYLENVVPRPQIAAAGFYKSSGSTAALSGWHHKGWPRTFSHSPFKHAKLKVANEANVSKAGDIAVIIISRREMMLYY